MSTWDLAHQRSGLDSFELLDQLPNSVLVVTDGGEIVWVNRTTEQTFGYRPDELVGTNLLDHIDIAWNPVVLDSIAYAIENPGIRLPLLYKVRPKVGPAMVVEVTANNQLHNPAIRGLVAQMRVWDEQHLLDRVLESLGSDAPLREMFDLLVDVGASQTLAAATAVYDTSEHGLPRLATAAAECPAFTVPPPRHAGEPDPARATPWAVAAATGAHQWHETLDDLPDAIREAAERAGFATCWAEPVRDPGTSAVLGVLVFWRREPGPPEPTAGAMMRRLAQLASLAMTQAERSRQLVHAASHDLLTGLPNRAQFFEALDRHLAGTERVGVLYLDLDGFKLVNDVHGHASGDFVLEEVATKLVCAVRSTDLAARLGGDEFAVLCPGASDDGLVATAERLIASIGQPLDGGGATFHVGASVGIAVAEPGTSTGDVLVDRADSALLAVKADGKGSWRFA